MGPPARAFSPSYLAMPLLSLVFACALLLGSVSMAQSACWVYIGTYDRNDEGGVHLVRFDPENEKLEALGSVGAIKNPSFLALHPNGRFLYAVSEWGDADGDHVVAFAVDRDSGKLTRLNRQSSGGKGPCHLVVDPSGRWVLVANYSDGGVATLRIRDDGSLAADGARLTHEGHSVDPDRQAGPHAHSVNLSPDASRALVADLGLDKIMVYGFDPVDGTLKSNDPPWGLAEPGVGPRHLAFHPDGDRVYVLNEMAASLTVYQYDPSTGALDARQTVTMLPEGYEGGRSAAEVVVHPNGRFVYASNRGHDSIAIYSVDSGDGALIPLGHESSGGRSPRNIALDPSGRFLFAANQSTHNLVVFRIGDDGSLSRTEMEVNVPRPVCIRFLRVD